MNNPFQEQLLKAGVVSKQQVDKVNRDKNRKNKVKRHNRKAPVELDPAQLAAKKVTDEKTAKDRALNEKKQIQIKNRAISLEIDKLITDNLIKRDKQCELVYNFDHRGKVRRLYVNPKMRQDIIDGKLGMARIEGRYELVPGATAEKIRTRNETRVLIYDQIGEIESPQNDDYADYQIPDDLIW
ncbi:MAG: hypothetical protein ACI845_000442 [Gammaproteobacteria bacterium]|jgi:uncharacterized protein YaiL (DUF2058 family)